MADHFWKLTSQTTSSGIVVLGKTTIIFTVALAVATKSMYKPQLCLYLSFSYPELFLFLAYLFPCTCLY